MVNTIHLIAFLGVICSSFGLESGLKDICSLLNNKDENQQIFKEPKRRKRLESYEFSLPIFNDLSDTKSKKQLKEKDLSLGPLDTSNNNFINIKTKDPKDKVVMSLTEFMIPFGNHRSIESDKSHDIFDDAFNEISLIDGQLSKLFKKDKQRMGFPHPIYDFAEPLINFQNEPKYKKSDEVSSATPFHKYLPSMFWFSGSLNNKDNGSVSCCITGNKCNSGNHCTSSSCKLHLTDREKDFSKTVKFSDKHFILFYGLVVIAILTGIELFRWQRKYTRHQTRYFTQCNHVQHC